MNAPLLLYDGQCGLCAASVQYVLAHERAPVLRFAPLGGPTARRALAPHPAAMAADSLVLLEGARATVRSGAALRLARYLRWPRPLVARLAGLVPRPVRDWLYDRVAAHRHRLAGPRCVLPPPEARARFLD